MLLFRIVFAVFLANVSQLMADVAVSAQLDKKIIYMDDTAILTIIIASEGESLKNIALPEFKNFSHQRIGNSNHFSMINGVMTYNKRLVYRLSPKKEGIFRFSSINVVANGKKYRSAPFSITVKGGYNPTPRSSISGLTKPRVLSGSSKNLIQDEPEAVAFVSADVNKKELYVNEQLILNVVFHRRVPLLGDLLYTPADLEGFWKEEVYPHKTIYVDRGHFRYRATKIRTILFPVKTGSLLVGSAKIQCQLADHDKMERSFLDVSSFFDSLTMFRSGQKALLRTKPIKISVKPLPKEGQPKNFSGAVGSFGIELKANKKEVPRGEAINLVVSIGGKGRLHGIKLPLINPLPGVQIYPSQPQYKEKQTLELDVFSRYDQEFALIFSKEGDWTIPPLRFSYFNPKEKKYCVVETEALRIKVNPSSKKISQERIMNFDVETSSSAQKQQSLESILRYFKRSFPRNKKCFSWSIFQKMLFFLLFFPLFLSLFSAVFDRIKEPFLRLFLRKKKEYALKGFVKRINRHISEKNQKAFYETCDLLIKKLLMIHLPNVYLSSTSADIQDILRKKQFSPELIEKIRVFMDTSDHIRFAGFKGTTKSLEDAWKEMQFIVNEVEKVFKR